MSLHSLSFRNIDPVPPCDSNSFQIGLAHWQDGLLWGPAVGWWWKGHRRPCLCFLKKTWLVMSLSGAISPLEMAARMTWSEQCNGASQRAPCTLRPQDTSWERGSLVRGGYASQDKESGKNERKESNWCWERSSDSFRSGVMYTTFSLTVHLNCMTTFPILQDKYMCW